MAELRVTCIVPTRNEERTISELLERISPHCDEIVVVDSSTDSTPERAAKHARVVREDQRGKGIALRTGAREATGDILVFLDADGSHIPEDIPELVLPIKEGRADMVIASRSLGGSEELSGTLNQWFRATASGVITLIINYRFDSWITDSQNGFRAIRRDVFLKLGTTAVIFDIETEMLMKALKQGHTVDEVPSREKRRRYGSSGINLWWMWYRYAWTTFRNLV